MTEFGGHVLKKLGDGLMALFGYPRAQENDAERAARAALAILSRAGGAQRPERRQGLPALAARIGLESGPVVVDATGEVFGDAPNVAARVQGAAEPGTVLVTAAVQRQVAGLFVAEDKGAHELKGVPGSPSLYRLVRASGGGTARWRAHAHAPSSAARRISALLQRRWERARGGEGQFVQIVGEPGLGKSRLVEEFRARLGETPHTWVEWASSQLLQNTPLHPLAEWGRLRFGGPDVAADRRLAELESTLAQVKLDPGEHAALLAPLLDIPLPEARCAEARAGGAAPPPARRCRRLDSGRGARAADRACVRGSALGRPDDARSDEDARRARRERAAVYSRDGAARIPRAVGDALPSRRGVARSARSGADQGDGRRYRRAPRAHKRGDRRRHRPHRRRASVR